MRIGIHQLMYLPWLGLFDRILKCDLFILLDNVAYSKNYFLNRNKIKTANGSLWLTIPVLLKGNFNIKINEVEIDNRNDWRKKHLMSIYYSYSNAKYFDNFIVSVEDFYKQEWKYLVDASAFMLSTLLKLLDINTPVKMASALGAQGKKEDLILDICKLVGADEYLSGPDGRNYLNPALWQERQIVVKYHDYQHPRYPQLHGEFLSHLSIIDLLFNCGPDSLQILRNDEI
jgi:hypothetical protein